MECNSVENEHIESLLEHVLLLRLLVADLDATPVSLYSSYKPIKLTAYFVYVY